jgi:hypothetical protein
VKSDPGRSALFTVLARIGAPAHSTWSEDADACLLPTAQSHPTRRGYTATRGSAIDTGDPVAPPGEALLITGVRDGKALRSV